MNDERKKILEMLAEGKITAEDAERLLDKIAGVSGSGPKTEGASGEPRKIKWLLVHVDSNDGDKVNIRVPINLIRAGIKLGAILPAGATERIKRSGFDLNDLSSLADDELMEALAELQVNVDSEGGDVVRIHCE